MTSPSEPAERTWTPAMELDDLWEGDMTGVEVNGARVLLVNVDGDVQAYRNRCPHQESNLDEGEFEDGTITCWRHHWQFDARTGAGVNPADTALTRYPCRIDAAGMICVDVTAGTPAPGRLGNIRWEAAGDRQAHRHRRRRPVRRRRGGGAAEPGLRR